jgi:hypothetical protein
VITVSDEMDKKRKDLWLQPHRFAAAAELKSLRVEAKITECPGHGRAYSAIADSYKKSSELRQACLKRMPQDQGLKRC